MKLEKFTVKLMENIQRNGKISGAVTGQIITNKWQKAKVEKVDFYVAKGYVDAVVPKWVT